MKLNPRLRACAILFLALPLTLFILSECRKRPIPETVVEIDPIQQKYLDWQRRGSSAIPEILKILRGGEGGDFRLRTHALLALGKIGDKHTAPFIVETLGKDSNAAVKNCAVIALADLKYTDGVPILLQLLASRDTVADPVIVIESLGRLGDDRAVPMLIKYLKSDNQTLALKSQNALAEIKSPRAVPELLALKASGTRYDKEVAVILGATDHPASGPALLSILNVRGSSGQIAAAHGLGERRYAPAMQSLIDWLGNGDEELLQRKCGEALGKLNEPASVAPLIALFDRP
ncbi:MAG: HEAT repeat domain-containing protein, partial [Spirochaetia bacterium]|nr:HEAT repeat domain-containing protein [Spirochaetia bacterium]